MKKIIGCFLAVLLLSGAWFSGCSQKAGPSGPAGNGNLGTGGSAPTSTSTVTATPQANQLTVNLGSASSFVVLAGSMVLVNGLTTLCGDLGISPGTVLVGSPVMNCGGVMHVADSAATVAEIDLNTAYNDAVGRGSAVPVSSDLGGQTLYPGLYQSTGTLVISSGDLTLDALGDANAVFIFQIASSLSVSSTRQVLLAGGTKAANIFWQVGGSCFLGSATVFKGNILAQVQINLAAGALLEGRALSLLDEVVMDSNTITVPAP